MCYGPICEFMQNPPSSNLPSERSRWHTEILCACECSLSQSEGILQSLCLFLFACLFFCLFVCLCICPPRNSATVKDRNTKQKPNYSLGQGEENGLLTLTLKTQGQGQISTFCFFVAHHVAVFAL